MGESYDAVVVGSGPNGLAAAITLAEEAKSVLVLEADDQPGGGMRTEELLEPGFRHDVCSTIMALPPLLPLFDPMHLDLVMPPAPLAHPFDDGTAAIVERSVDETARGLDDARYCKVIGPFVKQIGGLLGMVMRPPHAPRHPLLLARFGLLGIASATVAQRMFGGRNTRAVFAGAAAHSVLSLDEAGTAAVGLLMLASAHAGGWPVARGGSASVAAAMVDRLRRLGGKVECGRRITSISELPTHRVALLDLVPKGILEVARQRFGDRYRSALQSYRHGAGVFKLDWTLNGPIPWKAAGCSRAATVHLGATFEEIALSEKQVARRQIPDRPFVILTQPTLFDPSRAPAGKHVAWAYCHVPNGSPVDMTRAIEDQVERFAPGFRGLIRRRSVWSPQRLEAEEPNCVGGDVMGGRMDLRGLLARPALSLNPYATPDPSLFICSAATPPGGGV
ncbi:MAG TPA: NAD(P)/FAD-dependent oxidoreductase, partial [Candidatus Dormibacteraeota bacterium]|nr:NAD(P)/FAD-dependent oxidoreductase [Candidatus Dormibacteraeota bacterium]